MMVQKFEHRFGQYNGVIRGQTELSDDGGNDTEGPISEHKDWIIDIKRAINTVFSVVILTYRLESSTCSARPAILNILTI